MKKEEIQCQFHYSEQSLRASQQALQDELPLDGLPGQSLSTEEQPQLVQQLVLHFPEEGR